MRSYLAMEQETFVTLAHSPELFKYTLQQQVT